MAKLGNNEMGSLFWLQLETCELTVTNSEIIFVYVLYANLYYYSNLNAKEAQRRLQPVDLSREK